MKAWKIVLYNDRGVVVQNRAASRIEGLASIIKEERIVGGTRLVVWPALTDREQEMINDMAVREGVFNEDVRPG